MLSHNKFKTLSKQSSGFTLIELLLVIAIIGILAAVLIPNVLAARNRASNAATMAYIRQVVTGVESRRDYVRAGLPPSSLTCVDFFAALPSSVRNCTYTPDFASETYEIKAESVTGTCFAYRAGSVTEVVC